ncbi:metal-dependent hydrolase [Sodalis endosymbiont of Henestaris halophilus]|uniref:metal-dependent hydrolase n=1 Tax=Sodalis endosymbiont of Henestaris halophilus TaxID=1929246 RepID=UPI000BBFE905|nr:metal-dependent hydrolase [Sodalis endosymbiont of Henestaris halophilus]SNC58666.1 putative deoxyribonuclease YcfH [Sodalis endosymbiont of Henestaris halophilus]
MFLVDSHCHLDYLNYQTLHQDVEDVAAKARSRDVKLMLAVCTTLTGFHTMKAIIGRHNNVLFTCGIHPLHLNEPYDFAELRRLSTEEGVVALGETGLDYYYHQEKKSQQHVVFREHIHVAKILNKPLIVHTRNAREDTLAILREEKASDCGGVIHCFTEDCSTAKVLLEMGFYISFSGIVTFRNSEVLRQVVRYVPLDRLLLETDSPYLAPVPYRGKENQPAYVRDVADFIAMLKGVSLTQLAALTTANFGRLFHVETHTYLNTN